MPNLELDAFISANVVSGVAGHFSGNGLVSRIAARGRAAGSAPVIAKRAGLMWVSRDRGSKQPWTRPGAAQTDESGSSAACRSSGPRHRQGWLEKATRTPRPPSHSEAPTASPRRCARSSSARTASAICSPARSSTASTTSSPQRPRPLPVWLLPSPHADHPADWQLGLAERFGRAGCRIDPATLAGLAELGDGHPPFDDADRPRDAPRRTSLGLTSEPHTAERWCGRRGDLGGGAGFGLALARGRLCGTLGGGPGYLPI